MANASLLPYNLYYSQQNILSTKLANVASSEVFSGQIFHEIIISPYAKIKKLIHHHHVDYATGWLICNKND
jgi:hypothetical protein